MKPGPVTPKDKPIAYRFLKPEGNRSRQDSLILGKAYVHGNIAEGYPAVNEDNWNGGVQVEDQDGAGEYEETLRVNTPFPMAQVSIMPTLEAYDFVLNNAGATLPVRDAVDERIVEQVRTGKIHHKEEDILTGVGSEYINRRLSEDSYKKGIITHISQVGGYPEYEGEPYVDTDDDGMPDEWELRYGLNPRDPADANGDINEDGYTNIEDYINGIDPEKTIDWKNPNNNYDTLMENGVFLR